jgi:hypothetical protein
MIDSQGETITKDAMAKAWEDYMQFGNIREMHQPSAVGVVKEYQFDDVGVQIGVYVVDDMAWKKVVEEVYKGFSIGGSKLPGGYDVATKTITALKLTEISLVDRPANPGALITMWKADQLENTVMDKEDVKNEHVDKIADMLTKGTITPERLVELASADIAKAAEPEVVADVVKDAEVVVDVTKEVKDPIVVDANTVPQADTTEKVDVPESAVALKKAFAALRVVDGTEVRKGMYQVSEFASLLNDLKWLQQDCAYEAEWEGDNSPLPVQIAQAISNLGLLLVQMAQEEISELIADLKMPEGADPLTVLDTLITNSETGKDYHKFGAALDVLKAGARNSASDSALLQKAHDALTELGATCEPEQTTEKLQKAARDGSVAKALGDFEKMAGEFSVIRKAFDELRTNHETLKKAYDALPSAPAGVSLVVAKGEDVIPEVANTTVEPVYKRDGTVDEVATSIKQIHAGGGRSIFGRP